MSRVVDVLRLLDVLQAQNVEIPPGDIGEVWASCPLGTHSDSDPSFQILNDPTSESHGFWRCFGCSENGGLVSLVRKVKGFGGNDARRFLAKLESEVARGPSAARAAVVVRLGTFGRVLFKEPGGVRRGPFEEWSTPFRDYVLERGITHEQVVRWRIGYSLTGMRVWFPIDDERGRPGSYSARTIIGADIRYMTPHVNENPDPGAIFGRRYWPPRELRRLLLLSEGAIDALAVERAVGGPIGALGGSALTPEQWQHVTSFDVVVLLTDPDKAGDRIAETYQESAPGKTMIRARLPKGTDAQSAGPAVILETLERAGVSGRLLSWAKGPITERAGLAPER